MGRRNLILVGQGALLEELAYRLYESKLPGLHDMSKQSRDNLSERVRFEW